MLLELTQAANIKNNDNFNFESVKRLNSANIVNVTDSII